MYNIIWGFDVSSWQSQGSMLGNGRYDLSDLNRFPLDRMREHGCRFGVSKYSMQTSKDATATDHTRIIKSADMQSGGYHWCDPIDNWELQASLFQQKLDECQPDIQAFDVEQYWASWTEYNQKKVKKILTEDQIVNNFLSVYYNTHTPRPLEYTARWFTNAYVPTRSFELDICDNWIAHYTMARQYVLNTFGSYRLTSWDQVDQWLNYLVDNHNSWFDGSCESRIFLPKGFTGWKIWQFDSKTILPGCPYNIDLNIFNGTEEEYEEYMGLQQSQPEPIQDDILERVKTLELQYGVIINKFEHIKEIL